MGDDIYTPEYIDESTFKVVNKTNDELITELKQPKAAKTAKAEEVEINEVKPAKMKTIPPPHPISNYNKINPQQQQQPKNNDDTQTMLILGGVGLLTLGVVIYTNTK